MKFKLQAVVETVIDVESKDEADVESKIWRGRLVHASKNLTTYATGNTTPIAKIEVIRVKTEQ